MQKSELQRLQQELMIKEGVDRNTREQNKVAIQQIETNLRYFTPEVTERMASVGINIESLLSIDLNLLATQKDYRDNCLKMLSPLKNEISRFIERGLETSENKLQS